MPFTFAHPAIVLTFAKVSGKYFSLTALIIGSMIPDFEYFVRLRLYSVISHTPEGLFYFDWPLSIVVYSLFVQVVRQPLVEHLPRHLRERLNFAWTPAKWYVVLYSLLFGAVTHLVWDAFTHDTGYFVHAFRTLRDEVTVGAFTTNVYKLLQHGSTLIGFLVIGWVIYRLPLSPIAMRKTVWYFWLLVAMISVLLNVVVYYFNDYHLFSHYIIVTISGILVGILISSIIYHVRLRNGRDF